MSLTRIPAAMAVAATVLAATLAGAEECPKDKVLTTPGPIEQIPAAKLYREVLGNIRLEGWRGMGGFILRMRLLELDPGGFIPTHAHDDRPALVYVVQGTVTEHNTFCAVPIVHHAGAISQEFGKGYQHWWENTGTEKVIFLSSDVLPFEGEAPPYVGVEK